MEYGIYKIYLFIILLVNTAFGNDSNGRGNTSDILENLETSNIRSARHVEFATETTLSHVLNTIARNYPDLKTTKGQSIEKIKERIRRKLRQYMKKKKLKKAMKYNLTS